MQSRDDRGGPGEENPQDERAGGYGGSRPAEETAGTGAGGRESPVTSNADADEALGNRSGRGSARGQPDGDDGEGED